MGRSGMACGEGRACQPSAPRHGSAPSARGCASSPGRRTSSRGASARNVPPPTRIASARAHRMGMGARLGPVIHWLSPRPARCSHRARWPA
jgi:hypothetical protein